MINNYMKNHVSLILGGSAVSLPTHFIIGTGSGVSTASQTALITASDRQSATTIDSSVTYMTEWTGDWNAVEVSGTQLTEFGLCTSGGGLTGSVYSRTSIPGITFDGTNELRIEETWEVF